jgi:hypothetical protein
MQPPQLWQSSGNVNTVSPITAIALNLHISAHFLQKVHFSSSISGTGVKTDFFSSMTGFIKRVYKKVSIGFFHITVQELYIRSNRNSQVGGHSGFSGTAFSACNADNHMLTIPPSYELMRVT